MKSLHFLPLAILLSGSAIHAEEAEYKVGTSRVGGGVATVSIPESDFFKDDAREFPVSMKEAEELCKAYLEKNLPKYKHYKARSISLINFKQGRMYQLFFSENLFSLDGSRQDMAPDLIFEVTFNKKVIPPQPKAGE